MLYLLADNEARGLEALKALMLCCFRFSHFKEVRLRVVKIEHTNDVPCSSEKPSKSHFRPTPQTGLPRREAPSATIRTFKNTTGPGGPIMWESLR
ncbi:hypothetical protein KCU77_g75, partial [Aureobasidium melanogenum]